MFREGQWVSNDRKRGWHKVYKIGEIYKDRYGEEFLREKLGTSKVSFSASSCRPACFAEIAEARGLKKDTFITWSGKGRSWKIIRVDEKGVHLGEKCFENPNGKIRKGTPSFAILNPADPTIEIVDPPNETREFQVGDKVRHKKYYTPVEETSKEVITPEHVFRIGDIVEVISDDNDQFGEGDWVKIIEVQNEYDMTATGEAGTGWVCCDDIEIREPCEDNLQPDGEGEPSGSFLPVTIAEVPDVYPGVLNALGLPYNPIKAKRTISEWPTDFKGDYAHWCDKGDSTREYEGPTMRGGREVK